MPNDMTNPEVLRGFAIGDFQDAIVPRLLGICVKYDKLGRRLDINIFVESNLIDDDYELISAACAELQAHFSDEYFPIADEKYIQNPISPLKCDGVWIYVKPGIMTMGGLYGTG